MAQIRPRKIGTGAGQRLLARPLSLREFYEKRHRVLILRQTGGLGDILMHRMIFEDFKLLLPECKLVFACPTSYFPAVQDHPFLDEIVDSNTVDVNDYLISYCTSTACGRYESKVAPVSDKHRSDIWAEHCGVKLTRHKMHVRLTDEEVGYGLSLIRKYNPEGKKTVVFCPISAMPGKNLDEKQTAGTVQLMRDMGLNVLLLHTHPVLSDSDVVTVCGQNIRQWMGVINAADYVVSVDTAAFHFAGGIGRPLVGVFSWADGLTYGKYYKFVLVQKHKSYTPGWDCGPCFNWWKCPKNTTADPRKPCITSVTPRDVAAGLERLISTKK